MVILQTMSFIKDLLEYANSLGEIFQGLNSFSLSSGSSEFEKKKALGQYLGEWWRGVIIHVMLWEPLPAVRVLDALNLNMEHKARNFESSFLAAIFLLNNFHFVHKTFSQYVI